MAGDNTVGALTAKLPAWLTDYVKDDQLALVALVSTAILIVLTFYFLFKKTRGPTRDTVLIAGVSGAGKTVLYTQLRYGKTVETHTSMEKNEGRFVPFGYARKDARPIHIVDLPGHEKLRYQYTEHASLTGRVIFVIDSTTIAREIRSVAEYLYDILANRFTQHHEIPILMVCNKSDLLMALKPERIQALLEAEIDRLRATRAAEVQSQGDENDHDHEHIGRENEAFKFEHLPNPISWEACSLIVDGVAQEGGPQAVQAFLRQLVR
ncbi:signal recognition particle receptor beta subunit-domain-containing protein [Fimicolochytrium jonesii]|uniref:signal recognition particle receptor beta subunit-domain-containing protein n=1 Tax=Fimicolochytrium jonesii TaxID=1396493 RepID=UPI0022FF2185|nr:signal recognition particle receptor beta subunit-domain-containing protein [Fimicolochytrium jonesii]KAI8819894.1 signal recognition particle receptor beta subunit-domain-containing protein [Fimicolochytrium jonesii]